MADEGQIRSSFHEAKILKAFKRFCDANDSADKRLRLRNILDHSNSPQVATRKMMERATGETFSDDDGKRLYQLVKAFLNKSLYRKPIPTHVRQKLLKLQGARCNLCGCAIDIAAPVDHIVPFKYVGDELDDNYQMLCSKCNGKKSASMDYQIRFLLGLV